MKIFLGGLQFKALSCSAIASSYNQCTSNKILREWLPAPQASDMMHDLMFLKLDDEIISWYEVLKPPANTRHVFNKSAITTKPCTFRKLI